MNQPNPAAILFDLDGTLVDTAPDFVFVVNQLRQQYKLEQLPGGCIRDQVSNGGSALTRLTWGINDDDPEFPKRRSELLDCYSSHLGAASGYFPGFSAVLAELELLGIQWGIVTNKPRRFTEPLLERLDIEPASLVCADDVENAKPAPDALLLGAQKLDCRPADCWYVGDHKRDIEAALAANMFSIAVLFGYIEPHDDPTSWGADALIKRPDQLLTLL